MNQSTRHQARHLYWQGYSIAEIAREIGMTYATVDSWKRRDEWDNSPLPVQIGDPTEAQLNRLIAKPDKTEADLREMETLGKLLERTARITQFGKTSKEGDLNPRRNRKDAKKRKTPTKNHLSEEQINNLQQAFIDSLFDYQRDWFEAGKQHRIRNILKSRQIGATWYFAREALINALTTGGNQIFLSASRSQAYVFRGYIREFVREVCDVELTGDPIVLSNAATLYFLGTNAKTAQGYHGNLYMDEYFWTHQFEELRKVASGMAMHKKWKQTYFSTPSTLDHAAHPFWSGARFNRGRKKADRIEFELSHARLANGDLGADRQWRQIVTVEDAVARGCDLFDLNQLRGEYDDHEYRNLLMCEFVDGAASVFSFHDLQACMVDSIVTWRDFSPHQPRPLGDAPVWIGYDPSRTRDDASCVVIAPPRVAGGKFRIVEKRSWNNLSFDGQTQQIEALTRRYNVQHIAIDTSGMGLGVYELVRKFYSRTTKINYSVEVKTRLVLKAQQLIQHRRLEFDAGARDIAMSFLMIHKTTTDTGRHITYKASRSEDTGHADLAWATMHALDNEPLNAVDQAGSGHSHNIVEFF